MHLPADISWELSTGDEGTDCNRSNVISFSGGFAISIKKVTGSGPAITKKTGAREPAQDTGGYRKISRQELSKCIADPGEVEKNKQDEASCTGSPAESGKGLKINLNTLQRARKIFQQVL